MARSARGPTRLLLGPHLLPLHRHRPYLTRLPPGTRLPTVRRLAGDLGLAVDTVARAYRELERDGLVATRGRNGTVVIGADETRAVDAAADYAATVRSLGLPVERALEIVKGMLEAGPA